MTRNVRESEFEAMRKRAEAAEARVQQQSEAIRLIIDDLRMRADVDDDGLSVVNVSDFVWHKLCDADRIRRGEDG